MIKPRFRAPEAPPMERVLVLPRDDEVRKHIKHSPLNAGGMPIGFNEEGPTSWPFDSQTRRLLTSGTITRADADEPAAEATEPEGSDDAD